MIQTTTYNINIICYADSSKTNRLRDWNWRPKNINWREI